MAKAINLGIAGLGTVGAGVVRQLRRNRGIIRRQAGVDIRIALVAELDKRRMDALRIPQARRARDMQELVNRPDIQIVVELIGGTGAAKTVVMKALASGKHVVTANKALLAKEWRRVFTLAHKHRCAVGFESSVMAGVPVIRGLAAGLAGNAVQSVFGILNGTSNYILSGMAESGSDFRSVLAEAQRLGLCEADASLDIEGHDAAQKLAILASIATGKWLPPGRVFREGIAHIERADIVEARDEFDYVLRPLAICKSGKDGVEARVHPTFVPATHPLATVGSEFNAALINTDTAGPITLMGKGAGQGPAASGVVSDIIALARALRGEDGRVPESPEPPTEMLSVLPMESVESKFYLRFSVIDKPGVLSSISGVLGANNVSIASCHQRGRSKTGSVAIVMVTHEAREGDVRKALRRINRKRKIVKRRTVAIRIEE